jgi:hypothetical protein
VVTWSDIELAHNGWYFVRFLKLVSNTGESFSRPVKLPDNQPIRYFVLVNHLVSQLANQTVTQSVSQSVTGLLNQSITEPVIQ